MLTRRRFLGATAAASLGFGMAPVLTARASHAGLLGRLAMPGTPEVLAGDEAYWQTVQQAFSVDRSLIHLNNGGVGPSPTLVQAAEQAYREASNRMPFYAYRAQVRPQIEAVRQGLADQFGCDAEEIALTRNTSEGMAICQLGLDLRSGDEVLTTDQDYPRMMANWHQRAEREGIGVKTVPLPVPLDDPGTFVAQMEAAMTARTRVVMVCHMIDLTGQILPVRALADMTHRHGVPLLVDGAQTFGHLDFTQADLACDFFATSLHKWLMGPQGTGMLYIHRDRIADVWPLMPAEEDDSADVRKFEDIGTAPPAPILALGEALAFHRSIGPARKAMRLRYLRDQALDPLLAYDRVRLQTHLPTAGALATIEVDGIDPVALRDHLWNRHRIRVRPIRHPSVEGIRVSPSVYTTLPEVDRFVTVMEGVIRHGLPSS